jgi:uncharacterized membrane protein
MPRDFSMHKRDWLMKRQCSLSPRQMALAYVVLSVPSFSIAIGFTLQGYWWVMIFSLVEMGAVAAALLYYARHASDYEHIVLVDGAILVEQVRAGHSHRICIDALVARIVFPERARDLIRLEAKGVRVEVGRFVSEPKRREVARELCQQLPNALP